MGSLRQGFIPPNQLEIALYNVNGSSTGSYQVFVVAVWLVRGGGGFGGFWAFWSLGNLLQLSARVVRISLENVPDACAYG